jgi:hypothetical protein
MRKHSLWAAVAVLLISSTPLGAAVCNPTVGSWTPKAVFPLAGVVRSVGLYFPANGKFYVLGGRQSDTAGSDILNPREYDLATDTWATKAAAFGDGQVNNMVGGVLDIGGTDMILLVGGSAAAATTATSETRLYDPVADSMVVQAADPWPGNANGTTLPGGAAVVDNKLYALGGFDINVAMTTAIYEYDPAQPAGNRWTTKTAVLPAPLGYIPTAAAGDFIYTLGGTTFVAAAIGETTLSNKYDPALDSITPIAAMPRATGETRAVLQTDGKIWVLGGGRVTPNPSTQVDIYDPALDSWSTGPSLPTARRNFPADSVPGNSRIFTTGGYAPTLASTVNEFFTCELFIDGFESEDTGAWSSTVP